MTETISRQAALRRIVADGIESVLLPASFQAIGQRKWVRREPELLHIIVLGFGHGSYGVEWFVVSPEATDFFWGHPAKNADVADAVLMGKPSSIRWPAVCQDFELADQEDPAKVEETARLVAQDVEVVATFLAQFQTRRQLRDYLLEHGQPKDGSRFILGGSAAYRLHLAAVLAVLDGDPAAAALAEAAEEALQPWINGNLTKDQIRRLRTAVAAMGGSGAAGG